MPADDLFAIELSRRRLLSSAMIGSVAGLVPFCEAGGQSPSPLPSPALRARSAVLVAGDSAAENQFWSTAGAASPLIEGLPDMPGYRLVTFLWRGDAKTTSVTLLGGIPGPNLVKPFSRLGKSHVWYRSEVHPSNARFQYLIHVNGPAEIALDSAVYEKIFKENPLRSDPLNKQRYENWSYAELPDAPAQPWVPRRENIQRGTLTNGKFASKTMGAEYPLATYLPKGYDQMHEPCALLISFDGGAPSMYRTLDNLLSEGKLPPLVALGIDNISGETRERDLTCSDKFADFLAEELVPWARSKFNVRPDSASTFVSGTSLGGLMSGYLGLKHPEVFGKVICQSGSFPLAPAQDHPNPSWTAEDPMLLSRQFADRPVTSVEFYLEAGLYEVFLPFSLLEHTRRLRDVLLAKGYKVHYSEYAGGHNEVCWRGSFADALIALTSAS